MVHLDYCKKKPSIMEYRLSVNALLRLVKVSSTLSRQTCTVLRGITANTPRNMLRALLDVSRHRTLNGGIPLTRNSYDHIWTFQRTLQHRC